jgi:multidrug resistance protein
MTRSLANPATIAVLLGALTGLAPFALDTYLPAFPEMAGSLGASRATVQQSLTSYLAPYAAMMLVHGPMSDRYGRRTWIMVGLLLFCAGSLGCALAQSIEALLGWRMVQGLSVGATTVVSRALVRDWFEGAAAQRMFAQVNLVFILAPAAAPIVGGYLLTSLGWRSIFWFLLLYPVVLLAVCWRWLPETLPPEKRVSLRLTRIVGNLLTLGKAPALGGLVLMTAGESPHAWQSARVGRVGVDDRRRLLRLLRVRARGTHVRARPSRTQTHRIRVALPRHRVWHPGGIILGHSTRGREATRRNHRHRAIASGGGSDREPRLPRRPRAGGAMERPSARRLLLRLRTHGAQRNAGHPRHFAAAEGSNLIAAKLPADRLRDADIGARGPGGHALGILARGSNVRLVASLRALLDRVTPPVAWISSLTLRSRCVAAGSVDPH